MNHLKRLVDKDNFNFDELFLKVQVGHVPGAFIDWRVGMLNTPDTITNDLWENGGTYNFPSSVVDAYIWSTDNGDTQDILIEGMDADWNRISKMITLTGNTPVDTGLQWFRACRLTNTNSTDLAGTVYLSRVSGSILTADLLSLISVGNNGSLQALCTIPAGYTAYMFGGNISIGKGKDGMFSFRFRPTGQVFITAEMVGAYEETVEMSRPYIPLPEKTDVKVTVMTGSINTMTHASFGLLFLKNSLYKLEGS